MSLGLWKETTSVRTREIQTPPRQKNVRPETMAAKAGAKKFIRGIAGSCNVTVLHHYRLRFAGVKNDLALSVQDDNR